MFAGPFRNVAIAALLCIPVCSACSAPQVAPGQSSSNGLNELVVFDPGAHERGLPAVQFNDVKGGMRVDIPPTVHVHRYYYSGDKEFQGPIINGGPTVVVANHPKTGERVYIDVVLPPGAPRINHSKHGITYVYTNQRVAVNFPGFPFSPHKAVVKNHSGRGWSRKLNDAREHVATHAKSMGGSPLAESVKTVGKDTGALLKGATVSLGDMTASGVDGIKGLFDMIPGVVPLRSLAEEQPDRDYQAEVARAARKKAGEATDFVPTNR